MKTSGKNSKFLLLTVLVLALLFALYYYVVLPKQDEMNAKQSAVSSLQSQITTLQQQIDEQKAVIALGESANVFDLRKKVPANRAVDALLRNIEEIDIIAGTRVSAMTFNNYDTLVASSALQVPTETIEESSEEATVEETPTDTQPTDSETLVEGTETPTDVPEEELPVSTISLESLPPSLQLMSINLSVETPSYAALIQFLQELEQLERIVRIDSVSYALPKEENLTSEDPTNIVVAEVMITTFYYTGDE